MFDLKPISPGAIPAALEKAMRYRMLNEPEQAESICEDVLRIEPDNQEALMMLVLALTDRLYGPRPSSPQQARALLPRLSGAYEREYYDGIIWEREGIAWLRSDKPRGGSTAYDCLTRAMACFERAETLRPPANDDAVLRWNSCARMIAANQDVVPGEDAIEIAASMGE